MQSDKFILPTAYFAPISWYLQRQMHKGQCEVEVWESFPKQTLRNRCCIAGPNGVQTLTVPVEHCESKQFTHEVRVVSTARWQHEHWNALQSAYRHTPFFDYYADFVLPLYEKKITYLVDLNEQADAIVSRLLDESDPLPRTHTFEGADETAFLSPEPMPAYWQIFADKHGFVPNLSILDLLFNLGPEAQLYLFSLPKT